MTRAAQTLPLDNLDVGSRLGRQLSVQENQAATVVGTMVQPKCQATRKKG